jgi:hypothetical protein
MSRFDPEKVEWPGEPTHPSYSTAPGPDSAGNISMELGDGYQVVPADAYRELYDAAEQMANAIEIHPKDGLYPSLQLAAANFRGEKES